MCITKNYISSFTCSTICIKAETKSGLAPHRDTPIRRKAADLGVVS